MTFPKAQATVFLRGGKLMPNFHVRRTVLGVHMVSLERNAYNYWNPLNVVSN